jgi:hypothetical protein
VITARLISSAMRARAGRLSVALVVLLSLAALSTPAPAQAQIGRWLWYASQTGWHHVYAARLASGPHVSVFAEEGTVSQHDARMVADAFSWRIYPTDTSIFGNPPGLGTVSIALLPLGGITLGYFNEDDIAPNRPGADASHSNRTNMLYVRTPSTMPDSTRLADVGEVVAHELQHLIDFRIRVVDHGWKPEDDWLNEGLSVYAQFANHYFTQRDALKVQAAAADPGWQLTALNSANASLIAHARAAYGRAGLFVSYLAARFGPSIARDLINTRQTGTVAVAQVLEQRHASLPQVFADWGVASYVNQTGRYGYGALGPSIKPRPRLLAPPVSGEDVEYGYRRRVPMAPWTQQYLTLNAGSPGTLLLHVRSAPSHVGVAAVLQRPGYPQNTIVRWLQPDFNGNLVARIRNFGQFYTSASVVFADACNGSASAALRLEVRLVNVSSDDRVSRPAPSARNHFRGSVRHISHTE